MAKVAVLGAGAYGTALGGILAKNGYDIDYYDPFKGHERLKDVVQDAAAILICAPSEIVMKLLCHLPKNIFLIVASKGFLTEEPFEEFRDYAVLSGAGFADDIKAGKMVRLTTTDARVAEMFAADYVRFDMTTDRLGVLLCGALKNIYAIRAGELDLEQNRKSKEKFIRDATNEMAAILQENGADVRTVRLACGAKDLILTCGVNSRNYRFGQRLKNGKTDDLSETVEGLNAIRRIKRGELKIPETAEILRSILDSKLKEKE